MSVQLQKTTLLTSEGYVEVIERRPTCSLTPLGRGARMHSTEQIETIAKSIKAFGFREPVLIDAHNRIVAGAGRVAAATLLGMETVPTLQITDLSEAELRAYRIAANRTAELGKWSKEILALELGEIQLMAPTLDITATGFSIPEVEALTFGTGREDEGDKALPSLGAETVSKIGDLWVCGEHRVFCGDALAAESFATLMDGKLSQGAFLDQPYNCQIQGNVTSSRAHGEFVQASGEMSNGQFQSFLTSGLQRVSENCVAGAVIYAAMDWRNIGLLLAAGEAAELDLINIAIWIKNAAGMGSLLRSQHEMIAIFKKPGAPHANNVQLGRNGRSRSNVWAYDGVIGFGAEKARLRAMHPTCKPVALVKDALLDTTAPGDMVIDGYSGSGTSLIACERIGRHARVMDLDPRYVDVTVRRWEDLAGKPAVHAETGLTFQQMAAVRAHTARPLAPVRQRVRASA